MTLTWRLIRALHKKWSFPVRISSENVTKSAGNSGFDHIYWRDPQWKTSFFVPWRHVKKHFSLLTLISVTKHSFILLRLLRLISGKDSLKYMQIPPGLMLFGWSTLNKEQPLILLRSSLWGIVESKKVSDRHIMSKLRVVMKASIKDTFTKSWAVRPFKF